MRALQLQALDLQELLDCVAAVLTSVARLLVAAERGERVEGAAIDLDLAGADPLRHTDRPVLVRRPDAAGEAVVGVVGDPNCVVLALVGLDRQHRAEDLLLGDRHLRRHLGEDGGADEVALVEALRRRGTAGEQLRSFGLALLDVAAHALALSLGDEWAKPRTVLEGVARGEALRCLGGDLLGFGQLLARHQHPGQGAAGLARVEVALADPVGHSLAQVGVVEDHVRRLAAELHRDRLDRRRGELGDPASGAGRAGEGNHVDTGCPAIASPTTGPVPVTRLKTPAGRPAASITSARMKALSGTISLGFSTTVQPAARAGATLQAI